MANKQNKRKPLTPQDRDGILRKIGMKGVNRTLDGLTAHEEALARMAIHSVLAGTPERYHADLIREVSIAIRTAVNFDRGRRATISTSAVAWEPFAEARLTDAQYAALQALKDVPDEIWKNNLYEVQVRNTGPVGAVEDAPDLWHLSIKRINREPIHDWRHLQRIKDELLGPNCEAVEIYPAKDRLVDGANQYHSWGFRNPKVRFPVGPTLSPTKENHDARNLPDQMQPKSEDVHRKLGEHREKMESASDRTQAPETPQHSPTSGVEQVRSGNVQDNNTGTSADKSETLSDRRPMAKKTQAKIQQGEQSGRGSTTRSPTHGGIQGQDDCGTKTPLDKAAQIGHRQTPPRNKSQDSVRTQGQEAQSRDSRQDESSGKESEDPAPPMSEGLQAQSDLQQGSTTDARAKEKTDQSPDGSETFRKSSSRDIQRLKETLGIPTPEVGVFHLWGYRDPEARVPVGWFHRGDPDAIPDGVDPDSVKDLLKNAKQRTMDETFKK